MQTRAKTNSRYYIICKMKQQLSPDWSILCESQPSETEILSLSLVQEINGTCWIGGLSIDIKSYKLAKSYKCAKWWQRSARDVAMWPCLLVRLFLCLCIHSFIHSFTSYILSLCFLHCCFCTLYVDLSYLFSRMWQFPHFYHSVCFIHFVKYASCL